MPETLRQSFKSIRFKLKVTLKYLSKDVYCICDFAIAKFSNRTKISNNYMNQSPERKRNGK